MTATDARELHSNLRVDAARTIHTLSCTGCSRMRPSWAHTLHLIFKSLLARAKDKDETRGFLNSGQRFFLCADPSKFSRKLPHTLTHPTPAPSPNSTLPFTHGHARSRTDLTIPNSAHQLTHTPDEKGHRVNSNDSARGLIVKGCSPWVREGNKPNEAEGKKNFAKRSVPSLKAKKKEK